MRRGDEKFPDNGFEAWGGYMQAKIAKLEEQFLNRDEHVVNNIFNGVSIYVNGFTIPSADELKTLMLKHGGVYHTYQKNEDFVIASNLPDTKVKNMSLVKVVRPEWITESIKSNRLLDYREFLLYRNSRTQPRLNFKPTTITTLPCTTEKHKQDDEFCCNSKVTVNSELSIETKEITKITLHENSKCKEANHIVQNDDMKIDSKEEQSYNDNIKIVAHHTKTAADPNFISEFYNNSRLHHISQLGACFKQYVNELRASSNFKFPARTELKDKINGLNTIHGKKIKFENDKAIMHIDMDCFFVSVGLRSRPELKGKPVAVTHSKGGQPRTKRPGVDRSTEFSLYKQRKARKLGEVMKTSEDVDFQSRVDNITDEDDKYGSMSEIASCSYEARAKGIKNGMFMGSALRLCPELQTIPYDFDGYKEVAYTLYNTIAQYTLDIEAVSCDEMYVDCTELLDDINISAEDFAMELRNEIKSKTGCPCSTGFGGNRLQARLATKKAKPDGQFFLTEDLVEDLMFEIKLKDLPGVGRQISQKLESLGHQTCGSLQSLTLASLKHYFGNKTGAQLFDQCRGRDLIPLTFQTVRKSVSAEVNYGIRFENNDQCIDFLKQLSVEVESRMHQFKVMGKCITLKLMIRAAEAPVETAKFMGHGFCNVVNKSINLPIATNNHDVISKEVILLCKKQNIDPKDMRGIGIQVTKLEQLNSKPTKGALSKFFSNTKNLKAEGKLSAVDLNFQDNKTMFMSELISVSPKKADSLFKSPKKKSPILKPFKSPIGKKRGRPPKNGKIQNTASKNLINRFLFGQDFGSDWKQQTALQKEPDCNVKKNKECSRKSTIQPIKQDATSLGSASENNQSKCLLGLPWEKVRAMLIAWLDSGQAPKQCDVELISNYLQDMVVNRNIDKLYILLNFLRRRTREINNPMWFEVYDYISEHAQNAMVAVYGKKIFISD